VARSSVVVACMPGHIAGCDMVWIALRGTLEWALDCNWVVPSLYPMSQQQWRLNLLLAWAHYTQEYKYKGRLLGRFWNMHGKKRPALLKVEQQASRLAYVAAAS